MASLALVQALAWRRWARPGCLNPGSWQERGGGVYVSMVTMGVDGSGGRIDPALWAPTLPAELPLLL